MESGVVVAAEESEVGGLGRSEVGPVLDVVEVEFQRGLRSHPGQVQCRSLAMTARRRAAGMILVRRPTSMISESGPKTMRLNETVTGDGAQLADGEQLAGLGLVESTWNALQGGEVANQVDVGFSPPTVGVSGPSR